MLSKRKLLENIDKADTNCDVFVSITSIDGSTVDLLSANNVLYDIDQNRIVIMCKGKYKGVTVHDDDI